MNTQVSVSYQVEPFQQQKLLLDYGNCVFGRVFEHGCLEWCVQRIHDMFSPSLTYWFCCLCRSCPECRVISEFVIPSVYWVEDQNKKNELIEAFKQGMG